MIKLLIKYLPNPEAPNDNKVFAFGLVAIVLISILDWFMGADVRLNVLHVFPLAAIAFNCKKLLYTAQAFLISIALQVLAINFYELRLGYMLMDILAAISASTIATYLARMARESILQSYLFSTNIKLDAVLESIVDAVFISDAKGTFVNFNKAFATFHRFKNKEECLNHSDKYAAILDILTTGGEPVPLEDWVVARALRGESAVGSEYILQLKSTGETWIGSYSFAPIRDRNGKIVGSVVTGRDVTQIKKNEQELIRYRDHLEEIVAERTKSLEESRERFRAIFEKVPIGVALIDSFNGKIYEINPKFADITGRTKEELICINWMTITHPDDVQDDLDNMARLNKGEVPGFNMSKRYIRPDGSFVWVSMTIAPIKEADGSHNRHLCMVEDITARIKHEGMIHQLAFYDSLTKLPNRRLFYDRMNQAMASSKRSGLYGALMFLDLDNFKPLNDTHGHDVGDLLLIEVAERLKGCVREMDTLGRFGGDEFVVMIRELNKDKVKSRVEAEAIAEKIRLVLSEPYHLHTKHLGQPDKSVKHKCTASIGVVLFLNHQAGQEDLVKWADSAMFQAKADGRNIVRFIDPDQILK